MNTGQLTQIMINKLVLCNHYSSDSKSVSLKVQHQWTNKINIKSGGILTEDVSLLDMQQEKHSHISAISENNLLKQITTCIVINVKLLQPL